MTLVQGPVRGNSSSDSGTITLNISTPGSGNTLFCAFTARDSTNPTLNSITQTNVTWTKCVSNSLNIDIEIWKGAYSSTPGTSVAVNFGGGSGGSAGVSAEVVELSGSATLDATASNPDGVGRNYIDSGTTGNLAQSGELVIAATGCVGQGYDYGNQTSSSTGTLLDGSSVAVGGNYVSLGTTYYNSSSGGAQNVQVSPTYDGHASGCIATFTVSSGTTYNITASADATSSISPPGTVTVNAGSNQTFNISASSGYQISHVYVDSADQGAITTYTFYNVQANHTISVTSTSSGQWTAGAVSNVGNGVAISPNAVLQLDTSYSPTFAGLTIAANATITGYASVGDHVATDGYVTASGGASAGPGYRFSTYGPEGYFGGQTGVGLNSSGQIVLNAGYGGVVTATAGVMRNTLDDGLGNMTVANNLTVNSTDSNVIGNIHLVQSNGINYIESFYGSSASAPLQLTGYQGTQTAVGTYYNTLDDGSGNMTLGVRGSNIHLFTPSGYDVYITTYDGMGPFPGVLWVKYGLRADDIQANGFIETTSTNIGDWGGGAIMMGHGYGDVVSGKGTDMPVIMLEDTIARGFDKDYTTLWLKKGNSANAQSLLWGDMELGNLTANGTIQAGSYKSADGSSGYTGTMTFGTGHTATVKNGLIVGYS